MILFGWLKKKIKILKFIFWGISKCVTGRKIFMVAEGIFEISCIII